MFSHEKFKAFQVPVEYWETALKLTPQTFPGNFGLRDQLKRAASSISLDIVEGCGRLEEKDRK